MREIDSWLTRATSQIGLSDSELSRRICQRLGKTEDHSIIYKVRKGIRKLSYSEIIAISAITGVAAPAIESLHNGIQLVGYLGAGQEVEIVKNTSVLNPEVTVPKGATQHTVAVGIRGDALGSALDGWLVFYNDTKTPPQKSLERKLCVIGTGDGRIYVRKMIPGRERGRYDLYGSFGEPLTDQEVLWAEPVLAIVPGTN